MGEVEWDRRLKKFIFVDLALALLSVFFRYAGCYKNFSPYTIFKSVVVSSGCDNLCCETDLRFLV